jgi:serine phosphatase RsbU (regulator of sigma subunit)/pSer/pThr/pTyr-binding forkhead associated (FHA) protein
MTASSREIIIRDLEGHSKNLVLDKDRVTLGRSNANELSYPDDVGLSRQHLALERVDGQWMVEDLKSKNGTLLNGVPLKQRMPFLPGDRIAVGHLTIEFAGVEHSTSKTVEFIDNEQQFSNTATTVVANLEAVLGPQGIQSAADDMNKTAVMQGNPQMWALIRAGRELAGHRPLNELFEVIMDLSMEAVMAGRGVLLTVEGDKLQVRAARGQGFQISKTVRDRVLREKASILVRDAQLDKALREHVSIVEQQVRSILAVPLQTNDEVIGLIYLDSPNHIREFTREDLNLLTVMANVAAIRIEHARLNEVEEMERAMSKDLQQAALIQQGLLPAHAPTVEGMDIAGKTVPARDVGGDYYDFISLPGVPTGDGEVGPGQIGMMVGDVAGKGMPAALMMSSLQARVHVLFEDAGDLAKKIERLNRATVENCPGNRFITFFISTVDPTTGKLTYVNAGHNPPLIVRKAGGYETLNGGGGMILGILGIAKYESAETQLDHGDILVLFSDGVTEAADPKDVDFGEARLADLVASMRDRPAQEIANEIHAAVHRFTQGAPPADDITVVVAKRL